MYQFSKGALIEMGRKHCRQHLPKMYLRLKQAGTLEKDLAAAAQMTLDEMEANREAGFSQFEAWEMARQNHLLLPEEADQQKEPMPENLAFSMMAEMNRFKQNLED